MTCRSKQKTNKINCVSNMISTQFNMHAEKLWLVCASIRLCLNPLLPFHFGWLLSFRIHLAGQRTCSWLVYFHWMAEGDFVLFALALQHIQSQINFNTQSHRRCLLSWHSSAMAFSKDLHRHRPHQCEMEHSNCLNCLNFFVASMAVLSQCWFFFYLLSIELMQSIELSCIKCASASKMNKCQLNSSKEVTQ